MSVAEPMDSPHSTQDLVLGRLSQVATLYTLPAGTDEEKIMTQERILSTRSIFTIAVLAIVLVGTLRAAAQTEAVGKQVPAVTHNTWTSGAAMPTPVFYPATGVLKNEIYIVGGGVTYTTYTADTQIYNPATNTWSTGASLSSPTIAAAGAVVKNILYVIGGYGTVASNAVWAYSPKTKTWSAKADMPSARYGAVPVVEKNIIYVMGGQDNNGDILTTVESYNPATNTWTEEAPLLVAKTQFQAALVGTTIVAPDGAISAGSNTGDNEAYDATTNTWTSLASDPTARAGTCDGAVGKDMYVAGGYSTGTTPLTESFGLSASKWTTLAAMPQPTLLPGSAVYKKRLYCLGGITTYEGTVQNNVQIYQP